MLETANLFRSERTQNALRFALMFGVMFAIAGVSLYAQNPLETAATSVSASMLRMVRPLSIILIIGLVLYGAAVEGGFARVAIPLVLCIAVAVGAPRIVDWIASMVS